MNFSPKSYSAVESDYVLIQELGAELQTLNMNLERDVERSAEFAAIVRNIKYLVIQPMENSALTDYPQEGWFDSPGFNATIHSIKNAMKSPKEIKHSKNLSKY